MSDFRLRGIISRIILRSFSISSQSIFLSFVLWLDIPGRSEKLSSPARNAATARNRRAAHERGDEQRLHGLGEDRLLLRDGRFHRQSLLGGIGAIRIVLQRPAVHGERHREGAERDRQRARQEPAERRLQAVRAREGSREFGPSVSCFCLVVVSFKAPWAGCPPCRSRG